MASNYLNKSSQYIQSLTDFILDTKPYHSKLTEIVEEYQFFDEMNVRIEERTSVRTKVNPAWVYSLFSGGDSEFNTMPLKALHSPFGATLPSNASLDFPGAIRAIEDQITDLNAPFVYSKKAFDFIGAADVLVERNGNRNMVEPLVEGLDYFLSHGSFQLHIKQTSDANTNFVPSWSETRDDNIILIASANTRRLANDNTKSSSSLSLIRALIEPVLQQPNVATIASSDQGYIDLRVSATSDGLTIPGTLEGQALLLFVQNEITSLSVGTIQLLNRMFAQNIVDTLSVFEALDALPVPAGWVALRNSAIGDGVQVPGISGYDLVTFLQDRLALLSTGTVSLLNSLLNILDSRILPFVETIDDQNVITSRSQYEPFLNQMVYGGVPVPAGFTGWIGNDGVPGGATYFEEQLTNLTPSMYFHLYSDHSVRESGKAAYPKVRSEWLDVSLIQAMPAAVPGEVWTVRAQSNSTLRYQVHSSVFGFLGSFVALTTGPVVFTSSRVVFAATHIAQPVSGAVMTLKQRNRLVFGPTAALENWNITKVNPMAYSRPVFSSTRYGYIEDQNGTVGLITIHDSTMPSGTLVLTAQTNGQYFNLASLVEPGYFANDIQVGFTFDDGRVAFTIRNGSNVPFVGGDFFLIDIVNNPAYAAELDLGYGYDLDSYDNQDLLYNNTSPSSPLYNKKINFAYDTRFVDYDLGLLNLDIQQQALHGRKWRIMAIPNLAQPLATLKKDNSGPTNSVDLQDGTSGIAPDPALNAAPLYSMLGDTNPAPDLKLYFASQFNVQFSDDDFNTVTQIGIADVGVPFADLFHGISFNITAGQKPFIAVESDDGLTAPTVTGGDVFSFTVINDPPTLTEAPLALTSRGMPRLIMHGDGFVEALPALWTVEFNSADEFVVSGVLTEGQPGYSVQGSPLTGTLSTGGLIELEGHSFNRLNIHFTIVPGSGGFADGDVFTFETYSRKPSYLVYGSVSGWQEDAVVGEPYWNGHIGFTIEKPIVRLFDSTLTEPLANTIAENTWAVGAGSIAITRLRFDTPNLMYTLEPAPDLVGWVVSRADAGMIGMLPRDGSFSDAYITIDTPTDVPGTDVHELKIQVKADDFDLWNAQDAVIIRPRLAARLPNAGDFVLVDKRTGDYLALNLTYDAVETAPDLTPLLPIQINPTLIDLYTGPTGLPIGNTSPEVTIIRNWIPLTIQGRDSGTSVAEFSDTSVKFIVTAIGTGETIGTVRDAPSGGTEFEWDIGFFSTYLPLNAESNIVTYGSGFNDLVNARISESVKFLIGSGVLTTDYMFTDTATVNIAEHSSWNIFVDHQEALAALVEDDPFGGFLAGYDNTSFDDESYGYDTGYPLVDTFMEAQRLADLIAPTPEQVAVLDAHIATVSNYLNGTLAGTSLVQFLANLQLDSSVSGDILATTGFGIPARGLGIDITIGVKSTSPSEPTSTESTSAGVQDAMVIMAIDPGYEIDSFGYDVGGLDTESERTASIFSGSLPAVPAGSNIIYGPTAPVSPTEGVIWINGTNIQQFRNTVVEPPRPAPPAPPIPPSPPVYAWVQVVYEEFETPLAIVGDPNPSSTADFQARVFEISFRIPDQASVSAIANMPTPKVFIWLPAWPAPQQVSVVERIGVGKYRVSTAGRTEAKIYLQPGP